MTIEPEDHLIRENGKWLEFIDDMDVEKFRWLYGLPYDHWVSLHFSSRQVRR